jgi:hypothetical protein
VFDDGVGLADTDDDFLSAKGSDGVIASTVSGGEAEEDGGNGMMKSV